MADKKFATQTEQDAADAAQKAGVTSPAAISDTYVPTPEEMHMRLQRAEGLLDYIFKTYYRNVDIDGVVSAYNDQHKGNDVIDATVKGRA